MFARFSVFLTGIPIDIYDAAIPLVIANPPLSPRRRWGEAKTNSSRNRYFNLIFIYKKRNGGNERGKFHVFKGYRN
jgi:hypothetical protein